MKEVLKAAYTLWCLLCLMTFSFLAAVSFLGVILALNANRSDFLYMSALCIFGFGWGMVRYSRLFTERVEKTKKAAINWDEDENDDDSSL